jgi:hypothetical protein
MWNWFSCYLSGRHDYGIWCKSGAIYLRCMHCGKRTTGITVEARVAEQAAAPAPRASRATMTPVLAPVHRGTSRVLPFTRAFTR